MLKEAMGHLRQTLGTKLKSSEKAVYAPKYLTISTVPK